jgi:YHS domain-containing protein
MFRQIAIGAACVLVALIGVAAYVGQEIRLFAQAPVYSTMHGAIDGFDPVAFHTEGRALQGSEEIVADYRGATWRFASAAHKELFLGSPEQYVPQYGGYCAFAMANGYTARTDPHTWTVENGRLFLNFDEETQQKWRSDQVTLIERADANWPRSGPGSRYAD